MTLDESPPEGPSASSAKSVAADLAALRAAYAESLSDGAARWQAAEAREAPPTLAALAIAALESMGPSDPISWGMKACDVLRRHGGADELRRLRAVRSSLPSRRALRDWRLEAGRACSVIAARVAGECTCGAEARHGAPVYGPQWAIEDEVIDRALYATVMGVRCLWCGQGYRVERHEGYHYPDFRWSTPGSTG